MTNSISFQEVFPKLERPDGIDAETVRAVFDSILRGDWSPTQVAGFVVALRMRGESPAVIAAAAEAMRSAMVRVEHDLDVVLDTCGTGGDGHGTVNLSTGAAIIAAAAGVPVAKHGNRAVSSKSGSADVLGALGIALDVPPGQARDVLEEANIAFLLAPAHHPAMRHAAQARKELGIRSIFNCLGPLANPAGATHQLIGAYDDRLRPVLADTLRRLGTRRAWIVHSEEGMDELSPFGPTRVTELSDGTLTERTVTPEDFGLSRSNPGAIQGGDANDNAKVLEAVLSGEGHPSRDAFILNAAAALAVAQSLELEEAALRARDAIESGKAKTTLDKWRKSSQSRKAT